MAVLLQDRALLLISGPDARQFLQGLITNDITNVTEHRPVYAALLTPQGKILFDFLLFAEGDGILIDCWRPQREALQKRLTMYRLRSKVEITTRDDIAVFAAWNSASAQRPHDPRLVELGQRWIDNSDAESNTGNYRAHRLSLGIPEAADFGQDKIFALDAGLDELHGVSFTKGCYIGQELTSRMKHRGTARKRLLKLECVGNVQLVSGQSLTADGREFGEITSSYGTIGFALIRLDRLAEAGGAVLKAGDISVCVIKQTWLAA